MGRHKSQDYNNIYNNHIDYHNALVCNLSYAMIKKSKRQKKQEKPNDHAHKQMLNSPLSKPINIAATAEYSPCV